MSPDPANGDERAHWKTRRRRMRKRNLRKQRKRRQELVAKERIPPLRRLRRQREHRRPKPPAPFVIGMTRSGTTLLRLMLDSHPELTIPPETHFIPDVIKLFNEQTGTPDEVVEVMASSRRWADFGISADELRRELDKLRPLVKADVPVRAFYRLYAKREGKHRWGDKTPGYAMKMQRIERILPEARFIHMIRDGRDVALSLERRGAGLSTEQVARRWRHRINRTRRAAENVSHYTEVRYEDLVQDPEAKLREICELIELDYNPAMLAYHERAADRLREIARPLEAEEEKRGLSAESRLDAHALTSEPPRADRVGMWRDEMGEADLAEFRQHGGQLLAELGYEV